MVLENSIPAFLHGTQPDLTRCKACTGIDETSEIHLAQLLGQFGCELLGLT